MDVVGMICFMGLLLLGGLLVLPPLFLPTAKKLRSWLKGSRTTYYLKRTTLDEFGEMVYSLGLHRTHKDVERLEDRHHTTWVIEISRGIWRRRSAIYAPLYEDGSMGPWWRLAKVPKNVRSSDPNITYLEDGRGLSVETALRLINTYPSLQAMLDRIAELERRLKESERQRKKRWAGIKTVLILIGLDRNKYRSKPSERIRKWLEILDRPAEFSNENEIRQPEVYIENWMRKFASEVPALPASRQATKA